MQLQNVKNYGCQSAYLAKYSFQPMPKSIFSEVKTQLFPKLHFTYSIS